jgi:hypothetical protein
MAIFMDNGNGDIYGGPTKEAVIAAMLADSADYDAGVAFEVPGSYQMRMTDEDESETEELSTLAEEYTEELGAYCIASNNC